MIVHFKELEIEYPEFKGVFVGGCIKRGEGSSFRAKAHAHNQVGDKYFGWVCVRSQKRLYKANGEPSQLILHELAHILTPNHKHDDTWRKQMIKLNQPLPKQYWKKIKVYSKYDKRLSTYKLINPRKYL